MQLGINVAPIRHRACNPGADLEHAVRANYELGLVSDDDPQLSADDGAQPRSSPVGLKVLCVAGRNGHCAVVHGATGNDFDGLVGGEVRIGSCEGWCEGEGRLVKVVKALMRQSV